jgi:predicted RNA-binding Zn ribbon-like protein
VDLCNTYDLLNDPPDRLTVAFLPRLARHHEMPRLGEGFAESDVAGVRRLRDTLYRVFAAPTAETKTEIVNDLLAWHGATARLESQDQGLRLVAAGGDGPLGRLAVTAAGALAKALADGGADRLRTCVGDPCRCVYVDRTRANRQRYCCELCNDRMASAAYRRRRETA